MPLPHPIEQYTPLSEVELAYQLEIYTLLNGKWLPISRRAIDQEQRSKAERHFARALARSLTQANFVLFRGPPGPPPRCG